MMARLTEEEVLLLDAMLCTVSLHNRVYVGLEPLFRRIEVLYVAILGRFRTQEGGLVTITQLVRVSSADALTIQRPIEH